MAETLDENSGPEELDGEVADARRRLWPILLGATGALVLLVLSFLWLTRDTIVENIVGSQLTKMGLPATYKLESAGVPQQVLTNIVIGDPAHPDMTIERAEVSIEPRLGFPVIGEVRLVRPRLYGSYRYGKLSFGSLDKVLFGGERKVPFRLPDLDLAIEDGRGLLVTDSGPVGLQVAGKGNLSGGFSGELAALAPGMAMAGCTTGKASLYGKLSVSAARPQLIGPLRLASLDCPKRGLRLRDAGVELNGSLDEALDGGAAKLSLETGAFDLGSVHVRALGGKSDMTYRKSALTARYDLSAQAPATPQGSAASLALSGMLHGQDGLTRIETEGSLEGSELRPGRAIDASLIRAQASTRGSLAEPLLAQFHAALVRQGGGSKLRADYVLRQTGKVTSLVLPHANLTGGDGDSVLVVSRLQVVAGDGAAPRIAGNFKTGGVGVPRITGTLEQRGRGSTVLRMAMAEYRAGSARLALPQFAVARAANGTLGFSGTALLGGAIPGGSVDALVLPVDGRWEPGGALWFWRNCREARFGSLNYGNLRLEQHGMTLCPGAGGAIIRSGPSGMTIAARAPSLDLAGSLGSNPLRLTSGPVSLGGNGHLAAHNIALSLGGGDDPTRLAFADFTAILAKASSGTFSGGVGQIHSVPLDLRDASGDFHLAAGRLQVNGSSLRVLDQAKVRRFAPLLAQGMTLELADKRITVAAALREPASGREVIDVHIVHDLGTGSGNALLTIPGITFDHGLQPDTLTPLALGVIANANGTVTGEGRIDWTPQKVTSTGRFTTTGLDFAAAFGPTQGVAGTVAFSDLLGLVTEPDQRLTIASINPGIEANNGVLSFELQHDGVLIVNGASWPFLDGRMLLLPTRMKLGAAEIRRYVLEVQGVSAARFVEKLDMGNLDATGSFDGKLPLVFDQNGGRIVGGQLVSRPPGGNVSYIGALTYKDLSAMANFAFNTLRSLDYRRMEIALDGDLSGEIVTKVRFDGVRQGKGAKRNFVTRQLQNLPIQMNINVRAPFFALISSFKQLYDPTYLDTQIRAVVSAKEAEQQGKGQTKPAQPAPAVPQQGVQPPAIGNRP